MVLLSVNFSIFLAFVWFYVKDLREEGDMALCSSFLDEPVKDMHAKVYLNEGKYLFYFNWGGNVFSRVKN